MKMFTMWLVGATVAMKLQLRSSTAIAVDQTASKTTTDSRTGCELPNCKLCPQQGKTCTECKAGFILSDTPITRCKASVDEGGRCGDDTECASALYCRGDPTFSGNPNCALSADKSHCKCQAQVSCGSNTAPANACDQCVVSGNGVGCGGDCKWDKDADNGKGECLQVKTTMENARLWIAIIFAILLFLVILGIILCICLQKGRQQQEPSSQRKTLTEQKGIEQETNKRPVSQALVAAAPAAGPRETVASLYPEADHLTMVTRYNAKPGVKVVRGRHWDFTDQDGGKGSVGKIMYCVKAPYWWMVEWPRTPAHAYHCGEDSDDRCDLAMAEEETEI